MRKIVYMENGSHGGYNTCREKKRHSRQTIYAGEMGLSLEVPQKYIGSCCVQHRQQRVSPVKSRVYKPSASLWQILPRTYCSHNLDSFTDFKATIGCNERSQQGRFHQMARGSRAASSSSGKHGFSMDHRPLIQCFTRRIFNICQDADHVRFPDSYKSEASRTGPDAATSLYILKNLPCVLCPSRFPNDCLPPDRVYGIIWSLRLLN
jgi:hypothetical protein